MSDSEFETATETTALMDAHVGQAGPEPAERTSRVQKARRRNNDRRPELSEVSLDSCL